MKAAGLAKHVELWAYNSFQPELALVRFLFLKSKWPYFGFGLWSHFQMQYSACLGLGEILYYLLEVKIRYCI